MLIVISNNTEIECPVANEAFCPSKIAQ